MSCLHLLNKFRGIAGVSFCHREVMSKPGRFVFFNPGKNSSVVHYYNKLKLNFPLWKDCLLPIPIKTDDKYDCSINRQIDYLLACLIDWHLKVNCKKAGEADWGGGVKRWEEQSQGKENERKWVEQRWGGAGRSWIRTEEIRKDTEEKKRGWRKDVSFVDPTGEQVSDKTWFLQSRQTEQKQLVSDSSEEDSWRCCLVSLTLTLTRELVGLGLGMVQVTAVLSVLESCLL